MPNTKISRQPAPSNTQEKLSKSAKGLRSRLAILDATLVCIAKHGLTGVTHRAIAAQAGVPHSLTTYFFKSLQDVKEQAFERFVSLATEDNLKLMALAENYIDSCDPAERFVPARRQAQIDVLTDMLSEFVVREGAEHAVGIAVELNVLYMYRTSGRLRQLADDYRNMLVRRIAELIRKLAPERAQDADTDASLVLAVLHKLELDCMNASLNPPRERVRREISRLLSVMFAVGERDHLAARHADAAAVRSTAA